MITATITEGQTITAEITQAAASPATVQNSDSSYSVTVASGGTLVLPDSNIVNSNSTYDVDLPATTDLTLPDSNISNSDGTYDNDIPATTDLTLPDSTISNSNDSYSVDIPATSDLVLPDSNVRNSNGSYDVDLPATTNLTLPDSNISNSNGSYSGDIPATTDKVLSDINITNSDSYADTYPAAIDYEIPDTNIVNSDTSFDVDVPSAQQYTLSDVTHTNSDGSPVVYPSAKAFTCTPAVTDSYTAPVMQTGQTTSYRTGDDGDIEAGRSFTTLGKNNPFGNTNRFTDELGTQTYAKDIVIDWTTWDELNNNVLGYYRVLFGLDTWYNNIDACLALSIAPFTSGWRMVNVKEFINIINYETGVFTDYAPFNISTANRVWTSNTYGLAADTALHNSSYGRIAQYSKSNTDYAMACRNFTITGTTLT